ncbi:NYN domain-containing protein [Candidatus Pacearchaeota archaeon]|nr:NYN domain-containing protein [Candidatus Pacearchaeota archaeon]
MNSCLVFLDGGFISKLSKHFGNGVYIKFDLIKLAENISKKQNLFCKYLFYYTAPPFQETPPTNEQRKRKEGYDNFLKSLRKNKSITVREGRCQRIVNSEGNTEYKQKGVDTLITIDLSHIKDDFPDVKKIILVSSDTDFCPVIRDIKKRWKMEVILYSYFDKRRNSKFSVSNELLNCCSKYIPLTKEDFDESLLNKK